MIKQTNAGLTVSVVMCTYNGEKYIREQLDSIVRQTYPIYELLIFDDASSDNTVAIVEEYQKSHPYISITRNSSNLGFTKNFEKALMAATGDAVAISDQDDVWITDKIERMMHAWKPEHPLIYCNSFIFTNEPPQNPPEPVFTMFDGKDARKIFLANTISGHAIICKREFIKLVVPFSEDAMYDWWMGVVAAYNGGVQHYPKVLCCQRSHADNSTVNVLDKYSAAEQKNVKKKRLIKQSRFFATAPNIPPEHKNFLLTFAQLLEESLQKKFHKPLFNFMYANRKLLFNFKKKKILFFSQLKHSYLWTLNNIWKQTSIFENG